MNSHTPTPWKACKDHEDFDGPYFDIDPEDEELYAKRPYVRICSKSGTVTTNHDFDEFKPGDAEFIIKACNEYEALAAIKETVAKTLAMLHAPGFDNNGGPSNIADEVRVLLDNLNELEKERAQIYALLCGEEINNES